MKRIELRFDMSKFKGCSIESFCMREVDGRDEAVATMAAKAKGGSTTMGDELVRRSLTKVNDAPVNMDDSEPFGEYDSWNSRTRNFVFEAFQAMNAVKADEKDSFLSSAQPL